jgi:5-methylcytosine-specific restriction protein A
VSGRYCAEHQAEHDATEAEKQTRYNRGRGSAASQGYDHTWRAVRLAYLRRHPLCEDCLAEGKTTVAEMVHHLVPVKTDRSKRLDMNKLRSLCNVCHEKIEGPERWKRRT